LNIQSGLGNKKLSSMYNVGLGTGFSFELRDIAPDTCFDIKSNDTKVDKTHAMYDTPMLYA